MSTIVDFIINLINWFSWFLAVFAVILGVYSGFLYMTSEGDSEKVRKSTKIFIFTIIGIIVSVFSFGMVSLLESFI
jgi:hypothetical protein